MRTLLNESHVYVDYCHECDHDMWIMICTYVLNVVNNTICMWYKYQVSDTYVLKGYRITRCRFYALYHLQSVKYFTGRTELAIIYQNIRSGYSISDKIIIKSSNISLSSQITRAIGDIVDIVLHTKYSTTLIPDKLFIKIPHFSYPFFFSIVRYFCIIVYIYYQSKIVSSQVNGWWFNKNSWSFRNCFVGTFSKSNSSADRIFLQLFATSKYLVEEKVFETSARQYVDERVRSHIDEYEEGSYPVVNSWLIIWMCKQKKNVVR